MSHEWKKYLLSLDFILKTSMTNRAEQKEENTSTREACLRLRLKGFPVGLRCLLVSKKLCYDQLNIIYITK